MRQLSFIPTTGPAPHSIHSPRSVHDTALFSARPQFILSNEFKDLCNAYKGSVRPVWRHREVPGTLCLAPGGTDMEKVAERMPDMFWPPGTQFSAEELADRNLVI